MFQERLRQLKRLPEKTYTKIGAIQAVYKTNDTFSHDKTSAPFFFFIKGSAFCHHVTKGDNNASPILTELCMLKRNQLESLATFYHL